MPGPVTVQDLLDQVRGEVDEANVDDLTDNDILACLNRAQRHATNVLARKFDDILIADTTVTTTASEDTYDIPEAAFGARIDQVVCVRNSTEYPLRRVSYRDLWKYSSSATSSVPAVYALKGRSFVVKPIPTSGVTLKLFYTRAPEQLVLPQGRITTVNTGSSYVVLDALGDDLTVSTATLGAFVNIVDAQTGQVKVSLQTNSLTASSKTVAFKTSGLTYASVYNRTIATAITSDVETNDYVCAIQGTCVPELDAIVDFLVQYAVVEVKKRFGESIQEEQGVLKKLEEDLERQWVGREQNGRIVNKSVAWTI